MIGSQYSASYSSLAITLASLANAAARASAYVDNTAPHWLDAQVQVQVRTGSSGVSSSGYVEVWAYGSADGATYSDGLSGADALVTLTNSGANLVLLGTISTVANSTTYVSTPFSVASAFGGWLPVRWGIVVVNQSGTALTATAANHFARWTGVAGSTY